MTITWGGKDYVNNTGFHEVPDTKYSQVVCPPK